MCAIAGMIGVDFNDKIITDMLSTMRHRGPDAVGDHQSRNTCLLHTRLSVIDPDGGQQPMHLQWAGESYTIVYNGELYNTDEIRDALVKNGHTFTGHSDTEVVLHAYAQWDKDCLERLNGIFAFCVWKEREQKAFLARDRIGVKPLFYKFHENGLLFSSEIKTVLAYPTVRAELDSNGVAEILLLGPGRTPGCGVFRGIYELEPGCYGEFINGKWNWIRYWKLTDREHTESFSQTVEHTRYLVLDAIRRQMVSDVPIGTFLSGGLDSSLISAVCAAEKAKRGERLQTFSVDYENNDRFFVPGKFQPNADSEYIRIMQKHLNSEHNWTVLKPEDLVSALESATVARDLPGMADVDFSLLVFCGEIRKTVKVALSGECADELFGGYPWYRDPEVRAVDGFPWSQNLKHRKSLLSSSFREKILAEEYVQDRYQQTLRESDIFPGTSAQERRMKEMMNLNCRWFMQTLLDRKDRMSMHHGLEVRVPFCDYRIAEYMYGVPWEYKDYNGQEKGLLRYAVRDYLPDEVLYRKKSPYPKTHDPHYWEIVSGMLREILQRKDATLFHIVDKQALEALLTAESAWPWYGQLMRVPQTVAYMLQIHYWLEKYHIELVG